MAIEHGNRELLSLFPALSRLTPGMSKDFIGLLRNLIERGMQRDLRDRDPATHANVYVVIRDSGATMKVALPMEFAVAMFVVEGVRARVERAKDELVIRRFVGGMGEVHVPEAAGLRRPREKGLQNRSRAFRCCDPIGGTMTPDVLGERDGWKAEDRGFASGRGGAGDVHIDSEICTVINARDHPEIAGCSVEPGTRKSCLSPQGYPGTVRRRAAQREASQIEFLEAHRLASRHCMADAALGPARSDDEAIRAIF